jgi:hypothetical protein
VPVHDIYMEQSRTAFDGLFRACGKTGKVSRQNGRRDLNHVAIRQDEGLLFVFQRTRKLSKIVARNGSNNWPSGLFTC